jgi:hypothetical protein
MNNILKLYSSLILTFFLFNCSTDNIDKAVNDLIKKNLLGKVNSLRQFSYVAIEKFGEISKGERGSEISKNMEIIFNENGNEIEINQWESSGNRGIKRILKYDIKGNLIEENSYNPDGSLLAKVKLEYDDKGNKVGLNRSFPAYLGYVENEIYKYDSKGNLIEENHYNPDGLTFMVKREYDDKGNEVETNRYNPDGSLGGKWTHKYDSKGNLIEDNSVHFKSSFKYDDKGNKIESNSYNSDGNLDSKNTYKYTFDKVGNWTQQIKFKNYKPTYIIEREIEYY